MGSIYDIDMYKGPWAAHLDRAPRIQPDRIVSKQNLAPGRERCKMKTESLQKYLVPENPRPFDFPGTKHTSASHKKAVTGIQFFRRYDLMVSAGMDGRAVIAHNNRPVRIFMGHAMGIAGAGLCFDERSLFTASHDQWLKKWDVESGVCTERIACGRPLTACCVRAGEAIIGGRDGGLAVVDAAGALHELKSDGAAVTAVSEGGGIIALTRSSGTLEFFDSVAGEFLERLKGEYRSVAYDSANEVFVACGASEIHEFKNYMRCGCWDAPECTTEIGILSNGEDLFYGNKRGEIVFAKKKVKLEVADCAIACVAANFKGEWALAAGYSNGSIDVCK